MLLKEGTIIADGPKSKLLTDQRISDLFDCPAKLARANGWYQVFLG